MKFTIRLILLISALNYYIYSQTIVINEVMYAPTAGMSKEWFELYNNSNSTVNIQNWKWKDGTSTIRTITNNSTIVAPYSYLIICEDTSAVKLSYIGLSGILIQSIGWNALNNTGDQVIIYNSQGFQIDSLNFTSGWGGASSNKSLERISASAPTNQQGNWGTSLDLFGATPNKINSLVTGSDSGILLLSEIMFDPPENENEWIELFNNTDSVINIRNWKIKDNSGNPVVITPLDFNLYPDSFVVISQSNQIFQNHPDLSQSKVIINPQLPSLNNSGDAVILYKQNNNVSDSIFYYSSWGGLDASLERYSFEQQNDSTNWMSSVDCERSTPGRQNSVQSALSYSLNDLVVNEIMFDPVTGNAEWLEFYNNSAKHINITGWTLTETGGAHNVTDGCSMLIKPGLFLVLASDSTILDRYLYLKNMSDSSFVLNIINEDLSLNNNADMIKLSDLYNNTIDSLVYNINWHNPNFPDTKGISLERISPEVNSNDSKNWSSSAAPIGGTPGRINSINTNIQSSSASINISPNPFSPDGDGFEDFIAISYNLSSTFSQVRLKIYDVKGRLVKTLMNNNTSGQSGTVIYDGLDEDRRKLRLGIYIVYLESLNDQNGVVEIVKSVFVVGAKL